MAKYADEADEEIDTTPICWLCGQQMEWTGEIREVDFDGDFIRMDEYVYQCCNPDCYEEDEEENGG